MEKKPLDGIRVVDFSWHVAAPLATKTLAAYGAQVIKIEGKNRHDPERYIGPYKDNIPGINRSGTFNQYNTGKLSVNLNLAHPKGVEIAKRFVASADIVIENFSGGVMRRMGLGYEELKKVKPDIIMLSSCMMGQTGRYSTLPGTGTQLTALVGFSQILGWPDRLPTLFGAYTDYIVQRFGTFIILAALDYRNRTGKGQYIDQSQLEVGIQFMTPLLLDQAVNRRFANRVGNRFAFAAPHNVYHCRGENRWCVIAVFTDGEWASFCEVVGNPVLTNDSKFGTLLLRKENEEELDRLVEEWTINYSPEEVMSRMQAVGVPAGIVQTGQDLLEHDPQLKFRHFFWELDHPEIGKYRARGPSFLLSKSPYELRRAPLLGEYTEYGLKEILGMSDEEVAELAIEGVLD
jgi:benzylsuccinate CoA-transferase BbsF subunit